MGRRLTRGQGFDEFMNVVLDDAEEVYDCSAKPGKEVKPRRELGEWERVSVWCFGGRIGSVHHVGSARQVGVGWGPLLRCSFPAQVTWGCSASACSFFRCDWYSLREEALTPQDAYC
jgi:hypothetical protein